MVNPEHFKEIMQALALLYERVEIKAVVAEMYWEDLKHLSDEELSQVVQAHRRDPVRGKFFPKPADLLDKFPQDLKHPHADVAWAVAVKLGDGNAAVITNEIKAARDACLPLLKTGDHVGARNAFKAAYEAILARLEYPAIPMWQVVNANSQNARIDSVQKAKDMGVIGARPAQRLLSSGPQPMAKLLSSERILSLVPNSDTAKQHFAEMKDAIAKSQCVRRQPRRGEAMTTVDAALEARATELLALQELQASR